MESTLASYQQPDLTVNPLQTLQGLQNMQAYQNPQNQIQPIPNPELQENQQRDNIFSDGSSSKSKSPSVISKSRSPSNSSSKSDYKNSPKRHRSRSPSERSHSKELRMKNGCCKECMRAFSKTGKSCLCQVPKNERKYSLPEKGCNYCGCHGCNPVDVRRDTRTNLKRQLKDDKNLQYKNQRLLDSDDEELKINVKEVDGWNNQKRELLNFLKNNLKTNPYFMGFGAPMRTPGYILGYIPNKGDSHKRIKK